jgi:serpin B
MAVLMCYFGAKGSTSAQIGNALSVTSMTPAQLHTLVNELATINRQLGPNANLRSANGIFPDKSFVLLDTYKNALRDYFHSDINLVNYTDTSNAVDQINKWIARNTDNLIKDMIKPSMIDPNTKIVLANAIYFKARWSSKFDFKNTKYADFSKTNGSKVTVEMMSLKGSLFYRASPYGIDAEVVTLPYEGATTAMTIILPFANSTLTTVESQLAAATLNKIIKTKKENYAQVNLRLPKFKFSYTKSVSLIIFYLLKLNILMTAQFFNITFNVKLKDTFDYFGVKDAFDLEKANFTAMSTNDNELAISEILHKANINVDENGTEASAATLIAMIGGSMWNPVAVDFHCKRPFTFVIHDTIKYNVLFIGKYTGPSS